MNIKLQLFDPNDVSDKEQKLYVEKILVISEYF